MIAVIDYGAGNLGSVYKALRYVGADVRVTADAADVEAASALVLPGVGAFSHCMRGLDGIGLVEATKRFIASGRPFLGICVGLQMLFEESEEMGAAPGLGVLRGRVVGFPWVGGQAFGRSGVQETARRNARTPERPLKVPHIGWNELKFRPDAKVFQGLEQGERVYFVHSYYPEPADPPVISATTEYGVELCCAVEAGNVHATQFHPEKSGAAGLHILRNFVELAS